MKQAQGLSIVSLGSQADWAGSAVLVDLLTEFGPPIPPADIVRSSLSSQVSERLVSLGYDQGDDRVTLDLHVGHTQDFFSTVVISIHEVIPQLECGVMLWVVPYFRQYWVCLVPRCNGC